MTYTPISKNLNVVGALIGCSLKLRIPLAIHLLATRAGFAPENIVIVTRTNEVKSPFSAILFVCFAHFETGILLHFVE